MVFFEIVFSAWVVARTRESKAFYNQSATEPHMGGSGAARTSPQLVTQPNRCVWDSKPQKTAYI